MRNRILSFISLVLTLSLLLSGFAWAEAGADGIDALIAGMSLRDKLAQMMFFCPRTWKEDAASDTPAENIQVLNETMRQYLADHRFGGILLYGENFNDAEQVVRLVADMQTANLQGGGLPMLMAVDQEGGTVSRVSFGSSGTGAMTITATGDPENARAMGRVFGEELSLLGIDTDFAPVVDVNDNPSNPVIGVRAFGDDADIVSEYGCAFMAGLQETGTIVSLKHFPGHGNTDVDSHTGLPLVDRTHDELMANELVPFKAGIDAGAEMVMTAHIQYPQLETQTYTSITSGEQVYIPATMSRAILTDLLRGELGFEGVIVSDALEMKSIMDNYAIEDVLTMTVNAGVDMLIMPAVRDADMLKQIDDMLTRAVELAESGVIDVGMVDNSVRRILTLKQRRGLLDRTDFTVTDEAVAAAVAGCGSAEHRQVAWDIACKGLTLLKNEGDAFPLDVKPGEKTLVLFTAASRVGAAEFSQKLLAEMGALPEGATLEGMTIEKDTAEACRQAAKTADQVLLVSRAWTPDCLDPATEDGFPVEVVNQVIDDLHAAGKKAVVISCQLPYDVACYPGADALLLSFGSGTMRTVPAESGAGSAWVPDLPAAICAAFGAVQPEGYLPVNLPTLDGDYNLTDEILYPRQLEGGASEAAVLEPAA